MGVMAMTMQIPKRLAWTHEGVSDRLREAMQTLARMPATGCFPAGSRSSLPDPIQRMADWMPQPGSPTFREEYAHVLERVADERHRFRGVPTAATIERMEEALSWQWLVHPRREWQALAGWAAGARTGHVARRLGVAKMTVLRWRKSALEQIVWGLNGG